MTAEKLAVLFHDKYETLAPAYGYETRQETRQFNPNSNNGKLMIRVCGEILNHLTQQEITHFHVADNSDAFRGWLKGKSIDYVPNGHFTSIPIKGNDIFSLGMQFQSYKSKAQDATTQDVELKDRIDDLIEEAYDKATHGTKGGYGSDVTSLTVLRRNLTPKIISELSTLRSSLSAAQEENKRLMEIEEATRIPFSKNQ